MRERADTVDRHLAGPAARGDLRLRRVHRAVQPVGRALRRDRPKRLVLGLVGRLVGGRAVDVGPLANSRGLEAMTAAILNVNRELGVAAGLRITGLP